MLIRFENGRGHRLAGRLDYTVASPSAWAVFAHCFTCTKNLRAIRNIIRPLTAAGIGVLRFDFTGLGGSEGEFADENFSHNVDDLVAASEFLTREYKSPALMIGHSLGGTAVLHAARRVPSARAIVTIGSPAQPQHVAALLRSSLPEIEATGEAAVNVGGRTFRIRRQFLDDLATQPTIGLVGQLNCALLVMHSPVDRVVEVSNANDIFRAARHPRSFVSLDHSDHLLSSDADSRYAGAVIAAWSSRYIGLDQETA